MPDDAVEIHNIPVTATGYDDGDFDVISQGGITKKILASVKTAGTAFRDFLRKSLVDAKGDLYVGTAADTVVRFPVSGNNGWVLTEDSTQTAGIKWAVASGGGGGGFTQEQVEDLVYGVLRNGSGINIVYDDTANTITINATGAGGSGASYTDEQVRDVMGAAMLGGSNIQVVVNDAGETITINGTYDDADVLTYLAGRPVATSSTGADLSLISQGGILKWLPVSGFGVPTFAYSATTAVGLTATTAVLGGSTTNSDAVKAHFVISPNHGTLPDDAGVVISGSNRIFSTTATGLQPNTTYTYQVQFLNAAGTVLGTSASSVFSTTSGELGFAVVMDPAVATSGPPPGWVFEVSNPANTVANLGDQIRMVAGGFAAPTHYSRVRRKLPEVDNFAAKGRMIVDAVIPIPTDFYTKIKSYVALITLDNFPGIYANTGLAVGAEDADEWRVRLSVYGGSDMLPRLESIHDNGEAITLWTGGAMLPVGDNVIHIDFTPSQATAGALQLVINGTEYVDTVGLHTTPNTLKPAEALITRVGAGIDDAIVQTANTLTVNVKSLTFSAEIVLDAPPTTPAPPLTFTDDFNDGITASTWVDTAAGGAVTESAGELKLSVTSGVAGAPERATASRYNIDEKSFSVKLVDPDIIDTVGGGGGGVGDPGTMAVVDNFSGTLSGWTYVVGQWGIVGGQLKHLVDSPDSGATWNTSAGSVDMEASVDYVATGDSGHHLNLWLRKDSTASTPANGSFYGISYNGNGSVIQFFKFVSGANIWSQGLSAFTLTNGVTYKMTFRVVGAVLSFYIDGVLVGSYTDTVTPLTAGNYGAIGAYGINEVMDNWRFGAVAVDPSFTETFTGANGTQASGWTHLVPSGAAANIQSNALVLAPVSAKSVMVVKTMPDAADVTYTFDYTQSVALTRYFYVWLRATNDASVNGTPALVLPDDGYFIGVEETGPTNRWAINKRLNGSNTIALASFTMAGTTSPLKIKVQTLAGLIRAKIWLAADPEPSLWSMSYTDGSPLPAGKVAFYKAYDASNPGSVSIDNAVLTVGGTSAPSSAEIYWGAWIEGQDSYGFYYGGTWITAPWGAETIDRYEQNSGKKPSIIHYGQPAPWFANSPFYPDIADKVTSRGAIPMIDMDVGSTSLASIAAGTYDAAIDTWATAVKAWGKPFFLRPMWEINAPFFSWGVQAKSSPATYIAAWRRLKDRCDAIGATNITWVWCVNIIDSVANTSIPSLYPGDSYVDWFGIDGYNWGDTSKGPWKTFDEIYADTYAALIAINATKPHVICEIASEEITNSPGTESKALWITDMFTQLTDGSYPNIEGLVWFNWRINENGIIWPWPIESSAASQAAWAAGLTSTKFAGALAALPSLTKVPRLAATNPLAPDDWTVDPVVIYSQASDGGVFSGFFPIGVDIQPTSLFQTWKDRGINTMVRVPDEPPPTGGPALPASINAWALACNNLGLKQIRTPRSTPASDINDPTLLMWWHVDEPDLIGAPVPAATIVQQYNNWKIIDPNRLVGINFVGLLNQGYAYTTAEDGADVLCGDEYPVNSNHFLYEVGNMVDNLQALPAVPNSKPVMAYIECSDIGTDANPAPSAGQMRAEIWLAIIRGARGIIYFPISFSTGFVFDATPPALVTEMTIQNARISSLANVLQTTIDPAGITCVASNSMEKTWRSTTSGKYFIVSNQTNTTITNGTVTITGHAGATSALVVGENRSEAIASGVITDTWLPFEVHVYQIVAAGATDTYVKARVLGATSTMVIETKIGGVIARRDERAYRLDLAQYFRYREIGTNLSFDYSPDGINWTAWSTFTTPFDVSNAQIRLAAASTLPSRNRTARFDNFNILPGAPEPPPPPPPDPGPTPPPPPAGTFALPTSLSQLGPRTNLTQDSRQSLPPGTYTNINFVNKIVDLGSGAGAYVFRDCRLGFDLTNAVAGRTVYLDHCSGYAFFSNGAQSGFTIDWSLFQGAEASFRPEGVPQNNTSVSTPMLARSCLFWSNGQAGAESHCEAIQALGGRDLKFQFCAFQIIDRWGPSIPGENTAPISLLAANCDIEDCLLGPDNLSVFRVYSGGGTPNRFTRTKIGTFGQPGTYRNIISSDVYPAAISGERPLIDGVPMP